MQESRRQSTPECKENGRQLVTVQATSCDAGCAIVCYCSNLTRFASGHMTWAKHFHSFVALAPMQAFLGCNTHVFSRSLAGDHGRAKTCTGFGSDIRAAAWRSRKPKLRYHMQSRRPRCLPASTTARRAGCLAGNDGTIFICGKYDAKLTVPWSADSKGTTKRVAGLQTGSSPL